VQLIPATAIAILVASDRQDRQRLLERRCSQRYARQASRSSQSNFGKIADLSDSPCDQTTETRAGLRKRKLKKGRISDPGYSVPQETPRRLSILVGSLWLDSFFSSRSFCRMWRQIVWYCNGVEATTQNVFVRSVNALSILAIPFCLASSRSMQRRRRKVYDGLSRVRRRLRRGF